MGANISILLNDVNVDDEYFLQELSTAAGSSPATARIECPKVFMDNVDLVAPTDEFKVVVRGVTVFKGFVYDFDRAVSPRTDRVVAICHDARQLLQTAIVGDPLHAPDPIVGSEVIFQENGQPNHDLLSPPNNAFLPNCPDAARCDFWTFARAFEYLFRNWFDGVDIEPDVATFNAEPHATDEMPQLDARWMNGCDVLGALFNLWAAGSWTVEPDETKQGIIVPFTKTTPVDTIEASFAPTDNSYSVAVHPSSPSDPLIDDEFWGEDLQVNESLSDAQDTPSVVSAKTLVELQYTTDVANPNPLLVIAKDLLKGKDNANANIDVPVWRVSIDPTQYSANGGGADLPVGSLGKRILPQLADGSPMEKTIQIWDDLTGDVGAWRTLAAEAFVEKKFDPFFQMVLKEYVKVEGWGRLLWLSLIAAQPAGIKLRFTGLTEIETRLSVVSTNVLPASPSRVIVRDDLVPRIGIEPSEVLPYKPAPFDNSAEITAKLTEIQTRALTTDGVKKLTGRLTFPLCPVVKVGSKLTFANAGDLRGFDDVWDGQELFVVGVNYVGGLTEKTIVTFSNVVGEPSQFATNAVMAFKVPMKMAKQLAEQANKKP
jgi:hypothetical protein